MKESCKESIKEGKRLLEALPEKTRESVETFTKWREHFRFQIELLHGIKKTGLSDERVKDIGENLILHFCSLLFDADEWKESVLKRIETLKALMVDKSWFAPYEEEANFLLKVLEAHKEPPYVPSYLLHTRKVA